MRKNPVPALLLLLIAFSPISGLAAGLSYQIHFSSGVAALNKLDYLEAVQKFEKCLEEKPGDRESRFFLGFALNRLGDQKRALTLLGNLLEEYPDDTATREELGIACYYSGDYQKAVDMLETVHSVSPGNADCLYYIGLSWLAQGNFGKADKFFAGAVERDPSCAVKIQYRRGLALLDSGRIDEALFELESAFRTSPQSEEGMDAIALARSLRKRRRKKYFSLDVETRYGYDSNVVLLPQDRDILAITNEDDFYFSTRCALDFAFPLTDSLAFNSHYQFFNSVHHRITDFNLLGHDLSSGINYNLPYLSLFSLYRYEYYFLDNCRQSYLRSNTLLTGLSLPEGKLAFTQFFYRFRVDDYLIPFYIDEDNRDDKNHAVGIDQYLPLSRNMSRWIRMGLAYERNNADGENYSFNGLRLSAELLTPLICELELDCLAEYYMRNYFLSAYHRYDDQQNYIITLSRRLNDYIVVGLQYELIVNDSTLGLFQYDRDLYSLIAMFRF